MNLYGLKDAGKTWFDFLKKRLLELGCKQSVIESRLFTKDGILLVIYIDNTILISHHKTLIDVDIKSLQEGYNLTDDGELEDYLGTRSTKLSDGSIELSEPRIVKRVLQMVGLDNVSDRTKMHDTPDISTTLLDNDPNGAPHVVNWNYRSVVGTISYLQATVCPNITFAVQQCACFYNYPHRQHKDVVKKYFSYLLRTKDKSLVLRPEKSRGLECFVDTDLDVSWQNSFSNNPLSAHLRSRYGIMYTGCPIIWASKM